MDIFTIDDSHRCKFHLELDKNKYREYSAKIVENGGEIVSVPDDNVFTFTTQKILTEHDKDRTSIGVKDKYNIKYVDDCINEGKLLDIGEYELSNKKDYGCAHSMLYFGKKHCPVAELLQKRRYTASLLSRIHSPHVSKANSAGTRRKPERTEPLENTQTTKFPSDISTQTSLLENLEKGRRNQKDANPNEDLNFQDLVESENKREDKRRNPFHSNKAKTKTKESASRTEKDEYQEILNINNLVKDVRLARQEKERREELKKKEKEKSEREINENLQRMDQIEMEKEELLDRIKKLERIQQEIKKEKQVCTREKKRIKEELEEFEKKLKRMEEIRNKQLKRIEELERIEQEHRKKEEEWLQQEKQIRHKLAELEIDIKIKKLDVESLIYSTVCDSSETQKVKQNNVNNLRKCSKSGDAFLESESQENNCSVDVITPTKSIITDKTSPGKRGLSDSDIEKNLSGIKRPRVENTTGNQMERGDMTSLENVPSSVQKTSTFTQVPLSQASAEDIFYDSREDLFDSDDLINLCQLNNEKQVDNLENDSEIAHESQLPSIVTQLSINVEERRKNERVRTDEEVESPLLDDISKAFLQDDSETDFDSMIESHSPIFKNFDPDVQIIKQEKDVGTSIDENIEMEAEEKIESPVRIDETSKSIDDESVSDAETVTLSNRDTLLKPDLREKNRVGKVNEASDEKKENFLSNDSLQQNDSVEFPKTNVAQEKQNCEKEILNQVVEHKRT